MRTESKTLDSSRNSSSGTCMPVHSKLCSPGIATLPSSSWSVAIMRASAVIASGIGPPFAPLCCAIGSTLTVTRQSVTPRTLVPIVGTPVR